MRRIPSIEDEIVNALTRPEFVIRGFYREHIAVRNIGTTPYGPKHLVVPYNENGEVRTAFITSDASVILRRGVIWRRP